jgi:hypothetical protein
VSGSEVSARPGCPVPPSRWPGRAFVAGAGLAGTVGIMRVEHRVLVGRIAPSAGPELGAFDVDATSGGSPRGGSRPDAGRRR